jgi:hypothetical protein
MMKDNPKKAARKENRMAKARAKDTTGTKYEPKVTKRDVRKYSK